MEKDLNMNSNEYIKYQNNNTLDILVESAKLILEGGNAFSDTTDATAQDIKIAFNATNKILNKQVFDISKTAGLGSTRKIINNINTNKSSFGDIDLLLVTNSAYDKAYGVAELKKTLNSLSIDYKAFFGNVFSCRFPISGKFVQLDLMVIGGDKGDAAFSYLHDLLYFSNEPDDNGLKGAHRTELIKSMVKNAGIKAGAHEFKKYKFNPDIKSLDEVQKIIDNSLSRARSALNKQSLLGLSEFLKKNFSSLSSMKSKLLDRKGYIKNLHDKMYKGINVDQMLKLLFTDDRLENDWRETLTFAFGEQNKKWEDKLQTTKDVLNTLAELLNKRKIQRNQLISIFIDYKSNIPKYWNDSIEQAITKQFPFMKGKI